MKIALRCMGGGESKFWKMKKVKTKNINKCFAGKMHLFIWNRKNIEHKYYTV